MEDNFTSAVILIQGAFGIWVLFGLLSLWVSSRSWHWFVRLAILFAATTPLWAIEAPDLMQMLLACMLVIFVPVSYISNRRRLAKSPTLAQIRWSLIDLLLATIIAAFFAMLAAMDLSKQNTDLATTVMYGSLVGVSLLAAMAVVLLNINWRWRALMFVGIAVLVVAISSANAIQFVQMPVVGFKLTTFKWGNIANLATSAPIASSVVMALLLFAYRLRFRDWRSAQPKRTIVTSIRALVVRLQWWGACFGVLMTSLSAGWLYNGLMVSYPESTQAWTAVENPSAFRDLVEAGVKLEQSKVLDWTITLTPGNQLRTEIELYADEFRLVEQALQTDDLAAGSLTEPSPSDPFTGCMDSLTPLQAIARALVQKSEQELHDGNGDLAMRDATQCVSLKFPLSRSNLILGELHGLAIEGMGNFRVYDAIDDASVESLLETTNVLQKLDVLPHDAEVIAKYEHHAFWNQSNWQYRLTILTYEDSWSNSNNYSNINDAMAQNRAIRRQLITTIALELFHRKQGRYPASLEELVPKYLTAMPIDPYPIGPYTSPLKYAADKDGTSFDLYSVGPNGVDDGGELNEDSYWDNVSGDVNFAQRHRFVAEEALEDARLDSEEMSFEESFE